MRQESREGRFADGLRSQLAERGEEHRLGLDGVGQRERGRELPVLLLGVVVLSAKDPLGREWEGNGKLYCQEYWALCEISELCEWMSLPNAIYIRVILYLAHKKKSAFKWH